MTRSATAGRCSIRPRSSTARASRARCSSWRSVTRSGSAATYRTRTDIGRPADCRIHGPLATMRRLPLRQAFRFRSLPCSKPSVSLFRRAAADLRRANRPSPRWRPAGFTLIELMIVLAIVGDRGLRILRLRDYLARSRVGERRACVVRAARRRRQRRKRREPSTAAGSPPAGTRNVESVVIDGETGQITVDACRAALIRWFRAVRARTGRRAHRTRAVKKGAMQAGAIVWSASRPAGRRRARAGAGPLPLDAATLPAKYAPAECRAVPVVQGGAGSMPAASSAGRGGRAVSGRGAKAPHRGESFV